MRKGVIIFNDNFVTDKSDMLLIIADKEELLKTYDPDIMPLDDIEKLEEIDQYVPDDISLYIKKLRFLNIQEIIKRHPKALRSMLMYWIPNMAYECVINSEYKKFVLNDLKKASENESGTVIKNIELELYRNIDIMQGRLSLIYESDEEESKQDATSLYEIARKHGYPYTLVKFLEDISSGEDLSKYGLTIVRGII